MIGRPAEAAVPGKLLGEPATQIGAGSPTQVLASPVRTTLGTGHVTGPLRVVLDLRLPDMSGFEILERIRDEQALKDLPVVVFTGKELSPDQDAQLRTLARSVVADSNA